MVCIVKSNVVEKKKVFFDNCCYLKCCFFTSTDMAKLQSLLALQQFMQGLGEDMDEAELVRSTGTETNQRNQRTDRTN